MARYKAPQDCTGVSIGCQEYMAEASADGERYIIVPDDIPPGHILHEQLLAHGFVRANDMAALPPRKKSVVARIRAGKG